MLLTVAVSMASCAPIDFVKGFLVDMDKIEEKCDKLEKEGEIDGYTYSKVTNTITVKGDDFDEICVIQEFEEKEDAQKAYDKLMEKREEAEKLFEELKDGAKKLGREFDVDFDDFLEEYGLEKYGYVKKYGNIVVYGTEDLCKKVI